MTDEGAHERPGSTGRVSRRTLLRSVAGSAVAAGLVGVPDTARAQVIETPPLHVEGNRVVDPAGQTVTLRGVNMADPKRVNVTAGARGKTATQVVDLLTDTSAGWHSRAIRIPVQPVDIGEHEPGQGPPPVAFSESQLRTYLAEHLDPVIDRCAERGAYAIVDYHRHRDIQWTNEDLHDEVELFWDVVAPRYADRDHVMYELYNEPQEPGMWGDPTERDVWAETWRDWKATAQPWVDLIRSHAPETIVLVGSPSWTQSPEGALVEPFEGGNIAYTYHVYPGHTVSQPDCHCWDDASTNGEGVAQVYEEYPLFVTEFGWERNAGRFIGGTDERFGSAFLDWLESSDAIHWTAWVGDPVWRPVMFERAFADGEYADSVGNPYQESIPEDCPDLPCEWTLTTGNAGMGDNIKDTLARLRDDNPPTVANDDRAPPTPGDVRATDVTEVAVTLSWDAVTDRGEAGLRGYVVYVDGNRRTEAAPDTTSTTVEGLTADTEYTLGVAAVDRVGNESARREITVTTDAFEDSTAPTPPGDLRVTASTYRSLSLAWAPSEDRGDAETAGLAGYRVAVDGTHERTVAAGTTSVTLGGLDADTSYDVSVTAVDRAGNESDPATLTAATSVAGAGEGDLLIDDFDGDPGWPDGNDLGNWTGSGDFETIEARDGALYIDYDGSGWFGTQVARDVTDYRTLRFQIWGEAGGEESDISLQFGGAQASLAEVATGRIGTEPSIVAVDLEAMGVDRAAPGQLTLRFYDGGDSAVWIDEIWLDTAPAAGGARTTPGTESGSPTPTTSARVTDSPTATPDRTPTDGGGSSPANDNPTTADGPGFGVVSSLVAAGAGVAEVLRRRRSDD